MNILHAIILGIIEGLTEFLPISSTAHLIIANKLLGLTENDFLKSFDIYIQLGAILAVIVLYAKKLLISRKLFMRVVWAFVPTAIIGLVAYPFVKNYLLGNLFITALALIIGGIVMILFEVFFKARVENENISYQQSIGVGFFQALAVIPGVSRSAATIIGGQALGLSKKTIVEFSFLLAIPTMAAASGLDIIKSNASFSAHEWQLLATGFIAAFLTALIAIRAFLRYIEKHSFASFGWYRIIIGLFIILFLL